jgi:antibiotic biosynthesis monooxygenase (ABM) superfamily enzyme
MAVKGVTVEVRVSGASSVIVHRVPPDNAGPFLEWQRGIAEAMTGFPGYQATDVYPPAEGQQDWVVILHFARPDDLRNWLGSPLRAEWLAKLPRAEARFELKTLTGGFGAWFTGPFGRVAEPVPPWKMALSVLLGLYPTVMLLTFFVGPLTSRLGTAAAMLIGNALSVSLLQWAVMPMLQGVLGPWLRPSRPRGHAVTIGRTALILGQLIGLMLIFRAVVG